MDWIIAPFALILRQLIIFTDSFGVSIILFAILLKIIMLPFSMQSKKSSMRMQRLNPLVKELEKKHAGNQQKYQESVSELYKEEKVNPLSGCLWALIPFPILVGLYSVVRQPITQLMGLSAEQFAIITDKLVSMGVLEMPEKASTFFEVQVAELVHRHFADIAPLVDNVMNINFSFLGMNLAEVPQWNFFLSVDWSQPSEWLPKLLIFFIPILSALLTFAQTKISMSTNNAQQTQQAGAPNMGGAMNTMWIMSLVIGYTLPAAMGVYWLIGYVWSIPETIITNKYFNKIMDAEEALRTERIRKKEEELELKRLETERLRAEGATERNKSTSRRKLQASERARQEERMAAQKKEGVEKEILPSQVGDRRYAKGRAYVADRFTNPNGYVNEDHDSAESTNEFDDEYDTDSVALYSGDSEEDDEYHPEEYAEDIDDSSSGR